MYQSNKFDASSFTFVANLGLKTVIYLSSEELSLELTDFFKEMNVEVVISTSIHSCDALKVDIVGQIHLGAKYHSASPWKSMTEGMAKEAIQFVLEKELHPLMLMCKYVNGRLHVVTTHVGCTCSGRTGIHMSGTVIGCLRRLQNWSLTAIIDNVFNILAIETMG